ncbi:MAG: GNAT family N-acetyltransferase [Clostridiales bacterium]|nr:GNAT family N-acetyltransferase [Clostridiales bacterium]
MNVPIDISNVVIKTERLILRPWKDSDLQDFYEYASVDGVGQMAGWLPHKDIEESRQIMNRFISEKKTFALEFNGKVIGSLGIEEYSEKEMPEYSDKLGREIGYVLSKAYWGQGLMPEAVQAVVKYLFEQVRVDFIACGHFTDNHQSMRVQEKCGFVHYKLVKYETHYGQVKDCWISVIERATFNSKV